MDYPVIVWFRRDLRLTDNPAWYGAVESGAPVIAVFVLEEDGARCWDTGGASRWWLHGSLDSLDRRLRARGGRLILRRGDTAAELAEIAGAAGAAALRFSALVGPESAALEERVRRRLPGRVAVHACGGQFLHAPDSVRSASDEPYRIFTPFLRACARLPEPDDPWPEPARIRFAGDGLRSDGLAGWQLRPGSPDWAAGLRETWTPGEGGALARVGDLLGSIRRYAARRDRPDLDATSRLSPHLHFGEVGPRELWHDVRQACDPSDEGAAAFVRQLYWREFSGHLLHAFPSLPRSPLRPEFEHFPWRRDPAGLAAWQRGMTGYPIVDAGMRQLWQTGWMHNRVRMLAASFLVKHLLIPWQDGAEWFRDTLVDADEANNSASWQWVAGCGTDAAPYFRIFNPVLQGRKFDPEGAYVRRWVPELATLDARWIHAPWEAPAAALREAGVRPGETFPAPRVEHRQARARALEAFRRLKHA